MKWLKDPTGRFPERPYYDVEELDDLSEGLIVNFLREKYGGVATESPKGAELIRRAAERFDVSRDAARVRLSQLGLLADGEEGSPLTLR